jgi:hypothetical protein
MATIAEIYNWFMTGKKPTQAQFWASWGSFWNKLEQIPISAIAGLTTILNAKAEKTQFDAHKIDPNAHAESIGMKTDKGGYDGTSGDLNNRIVAIENPDRVLKFGTITVTGLNVDIASNAFSWVLNKQEFLTPAVFTDTLDATTAGMYRSDVVVGNQAGGYDIITGDEASTGAGATEKAPPAGTIRLGYIFLQGNTVLGSGSTPAEEKSTIIDADRIVFDNSQNSYAKASIKLSNFKTVLKVWIDSFFKTWILGINPITGIIYTIGLNDYKTIGIFSNVNPIAFTVPTNSSVAVPIGTSFEYAVQGAGTVTVGGSGITFIQNKMNFASGNKFVLTKIGTDTWTVVGSSVVKKCFTYNLDQIQITNTANTFFMKGVTGLTYSLNMGTNDSTLLKTLNWNKVAFVTPYKCILRKVSLGTNGGVTIYIGQTPFGTVGPKADVFTGYGASGTIHTPNVVVDADTSIFLAFSIDWTGQNIPFGTLYFEEF